MVWRRRGCYLCAPSPRSLRTTVPQRSVHSHVCLTAPLTSEPRATALTRSLSASMGWECPFGSSAALPHLGCSTMSRRTRLHLTCKSRASGADSMIKTILLVMAFVFLPSVAFAQTAMDPGEGTDLYRVNREVEAMTRDGRWRRLLDEANGVRQAVTPAVPFPQPSIHTPVRPRALAELRPACQDESRKLFKGPRRMDPDLYKRVVERRQLYVRSCIDSGPQDVELTGSSTSTTIPLPPRRPVARL